MTAKVYVNGNISAHEFDQTKPGEALRALRDEAADKVSAARRRLEAAENSVIAAQIDLDFTIEVQARYNEAMQTLSAVEYEAVPA